MYRPPDSLLLSVWVPACHPNTCKAETRGLQVQGCLDYIMEHCLKKQNKPQEPFLMSSASKAGTLARWQCWLLTPAAAVERTAFPAGQRDSLCKPNHYLPGSTTRLLLRLDLTFRGTQAARSPPEEFPWPGPMLQKQNKTKL